MKNLAELVLNIRAACLNRSGYINVNQLVDDLNKQFASAGDIKSFFEPISTKDLSYLLYNLGQIAHQSFTNINGNLISAVLKEINYSRTKSAKIFVTAIYGAGLIAKKSKLDGFVAAETLNSLLNKLTIISVNYQQIANTIYGLGALAKAGRMNAEIGASDLQSLLCQLRTINPDAQAISNTIYGLGELAKAGRMSAEISVGDLQSLLRQLGSQNPEAQAIANTIYGLGALAKAGRMNAEIGVDDLQSLLGQLRTKNPEAQAIANTIYGLGALAKSGRMNAEIGVGGLQLLLGQLVNRNPDEQTIANTIYGLGALAKAGRMNGEIGVGDLQLLLGQLVNRNPDAQTIANAIYGLGALAKAGRMSSRIVASDLQLLLSQLANRNPDAQAIANTIYGLGALAKAGRMNAEIGVDDLQSLLGQLRTQNPEAQAISNTIYGLGELAKAGRMSAEIGVGDLQSLLGQLVTKNPDAQAIANTIYGLGELAKSRRMNAGIDVGNLQKLLEIALGNDLSIVENVLDIRYVCQMLQGLIEVTVEGDVSLLKPSIEELFAFIKDLYIHPNDLIVLLDNYNSLSLRGSINHEIFLSLKDQLQACGLESRHLTDVQQTKIQSCLPQERAAVKNKSYQVPVAPAGWGEAQKGGIFAAIANQDLPKLCRLLGVNEITPKAKQIVERNSVFQFYPVRSSKFGVEEDVRFDRKKTSDLLTMKFFKTNRVCLQYLIEHSKHEFFYYILYACNKHNQYQLAKEHVLNPILLYLPLDELKFMIKKFIDLGFYQDHQAILALVDGLFLRKHIHHSEIEDITKLQKQLLMQAIEHHQKRDHRIVTPKLNIRLQQIQNGVETLQEQEEENQVVVLSSANIHQQSIFRPRAEKRKISEVDSYIEDPLMKITQEDVEPNEQAYYGAETVNRLLSLMLRAKTSLSILGAIDYQTKDPSFQKFHETVANYIGNLDQGGECAKDLIIPICIHKHWVGVRIYDESQDAINITYYDSSVGDSYQKILEPVIRSVVSELYGKKENWTEKSYYKQTDGCSCGVYLVDNIIKDVFSSIGKKINAVQRRQQHLDLLKKHDPNYYNKRKRSMNHIF